MEIKLTAIKLKLMTNEKEKPLISLAQQAMARADETVETCENILSMTEAAEARCNQLSAAAASVLEMGAHCDQIKVRIDAAFDRKIAEAMEIQNLEAAEKINQAKQNLRR